MEETKGLVPDQSGKVEVEVMDDNHTHEGKSCKKGDKIMVTPEAAEMLRKVWAAAKKVQ